MSKCRSGGAYRSRIVLTYSPFTGLTGVILTYTYRSRNEALHLLIRTYLPLEEWGPTPTYTYLLTA